MLARAHVVPPLPPLPYSIALVLFGAGQEETPQNHHQSRCQRAELMVRCPNSHRSLLGDGINGHRKGSFGDGVTVLGDDELRLGVVRGAKGQIHHLRVHDEPVCIVRVDRGRENLPPLSLIVHLQVHDRFHAVVPHVERLREPTVPHVPQERLLVVGFVVPFGVAREATVEASPAVLHEEEELPQLVALGARHGRILGTAVERLADAVDDAADLRLELAEPELEILLVRRGGEVSIHVNQPESSTYRRFLQLWRIWSQLQRVEDFLPRIERWLCIFLRATLFPGGTISVREVPEDELRDEVVVLGGFFGGSALAGAHLGYLSPGCVQRWLLLH